MKILLIVALTFLFSGAKEPPKAIQVKPLKHLQVSLDSTNQKLDTLLILIK